MDDFKLIREIVCDIKIIMVKLLKLGFLVLICLKFKVSSRDLSRIAGLRMHAGRHVTKSLRLAVFGVKVVKMV